MILLPNKCEGCGACCINTKDFKWIEVTLADAARLDHRFLQEGDVQPFAMKQTADGRCVCLDADNRCSIYENRPTICRTVQMGDSICLTSLAPVV